MVTGAPGPDRGRRADQQLRVGLLERGGDAVDGHRLDGEPGRVEGDLSSGRDDVVDRDRPVDDLGRRVVGEPHVVRLHVEVGRAELREQRSPLVVDGPAGSPAGPLVAGARRVSAGSSARRSSGRRLGRGRAATSASAARPWRRCARRRSADRGAHAPPEQAASTATSASAARRRASAVDRRDRSTWARWRTVCTESPDSTAPRASSRPPCQFDSPSSGVSSANWPSTHG